VTAYCMFSIDARSTLLSGSFFFPSAPTVDWRKQFIGEDSVMQYRR